MKDLKENNSGIEFLTEYKNRFFRSSKFWLGFFILLASIALFLVFKLTVMDTSISERELKTGIAFFSISSQWVIKEKVSEPDFQGIILVPQVSFRVRNEGQRPLKDIFLVGVFRFMDNGYAMGEGYRFILRKSLNPGGESEAIVLTSGLGYRARGIESFEKNRANWRDALVEIYAKTGSLKITFLKSFYISRKIKGQDIKVRIT